MYNNMPNKATYLKCKIISIMMKYILRSKEYENLRAQEPRMRGFVVFAPKDDALVSEGVISRKKAGSILGELDYGDINIYAKIAELERKYVPYWKARSEPGQDFVNMLEVHKTTNGFINVFLFMEEDKPQLYKIETESGITAAMPLELVLLDC